MSAAPDRTWRRFTLTVAVLAGVALAVGLALSYGSVYRAAYDAGFDRPWINTRTWQLRPAHLFPLTLDVPVLVGYAGTIALVGRRSVAWARLVLVACGAATIALQVVDGADVIQDGHVVKAVIHGWPPALAILTAHLLVKILQALGFLLPPVAEEAPSWAARAWRWGVQLAADIRVTLAAFRRGDMDRPQEPVIDPAAAGDTGPDAQADTSRDTGPDTNRPAGPDSDGDSDPDKPQVNPVIPFTGKKGRVVAQVMAKTMTQARAADLMKVSPKTISRWVAEAKTRQAEQATG